MTTTDENLTSTTQDEPTSPSTAAGDVLARVASSLLSLAPQLQDDLVAHYVAEEKKARLACLLKAFTKKKALTEELEVKKRPKAGEKVFTAAGEVITREATYTKDELDARNKAIAEATRKLTEFEAVFEKALTLGNAKDFEKLNKLVG